MAKYMVGVLLCFHLIAVGQTSKLRPNDCWVRRSVLDNRPRIVSVMLKEDFYVAYDGESCGIYKIWKDGINFNGAVYTSKHGPQPETVGKPYTEGLVEVPVWKVMKENKEIPSTIQFKGYYWKGDVVKFRYTVSISGAQMQVEETPNYVLGANGAIGFERKFTTSNIPTGVELYHLAKYEKLKKPNDFKVVGEFKPVQKLETYVGTTTLYTITHLVKMKSQGITTIITYHHPSVLL